MRRKRLLALTLLFFLVLCPFAAALLLTRTQPISQALPAPVSPTALDLTTWSPVEPLVTGTPAAAPIFATRWAVETQVAATSTALTPRP